MADLEKDIKTRQVDPKSVRVIERLVCENVDGKSVTSKRVSDPEATPYNTHFNIDSSVIQTNKFPAFGPARPDLRYRYSLGKDSSAVETWQHREVESHTGVSSYSVIPKSSIPTTKPLPDPSPSG